MISFLECSMAIQNVLMILLEICMILELILLLVRITCFSGKKKIVTAVAVFVVSFMFMGALMNDHRYCLGESSYQPMLQGYPVSVFMTVVIGLLLYLCWAIRSERCRYHHSLSYWSVNEAVNDVPCGVCFSDPLGRIVLCNTKMQELSRIMTGSYLQDYDALRKAMNGRPESEGLRRLSKDSNVFYFPDGSVWMFQEYSLQEPDCAGYLQTVAVNVSEIYYNGEKIRANNEKLEILNRKLEEMYEKIGDKIREQETLVMKMQVHDNFGRSLLSIRRILERKEDPDKMDKQLSVLKHLVYILTGSAVESMEEVYKDTIRHAEELGISVQISGNFPMHPSYRLLTDRAIRECVTNCARHAHGSTVWVKIDKNADEYTVQITNDGEVPDKNAEEGGGLSALRKAAESGKCRMQVSFSPEFCLILKMPLTERMGFDGTDTDSRRSEDQKIMQKYFEYIIMQEPEFRHVQTVSDAREAVKICDYSAIDLVIMDVQTFHNHDGLSAGKVIREKYPYTKVLIVTSLIDPKVLERAKCGCADSLWYKDHGEEEIRSVIHRTLNGEHVFPDVTPKVELNWITSGDISPRQLEMLRLYIRGMSYSEIAREMKCSTSGVRWNFQEMIARAGYSCKEDLIAAALESKLIVTTLK